MKTYGSPGASAAFLARRRRRLRAGTGVVVLAGTIAAVATGRPTAAIGLLVAGFLVRYRLAGTAHAADVGAAAEAEVAARLRSFRPDVLLFDVDLRNRRTDIDAVVLGPVVATVEVKRARGRVKVMSDGSVRAGRRWLPGRPVAQAASHAAAVGRYTDHHVEAVLCITGMRRRPTIVEYGKGEVWVTSARRLERTLRKLPNEINSGEACQIATRLRTGNNASNRGIRSVR